jgi:hypothetical protein
VLLTSTDNNVLLLRQLIEEAAQNISQEFPWPELQKEYTFTLATSTAAYALPGDFDRQLSETHWNRTSHWPLDGPLNAGEWQTYKSGLSGSIPNQKFRVKGWGSTQFYIDPTPTSDENGDTMAYEYIIRTVFRPKTWAASTVFAAASYCSYNGNIYYTSAGGTTGATPPTHVTGSASDDVVTWVYQTTYFDTVTADTDETIIDQRLVIDRVIWRFKQERGLDFAELKAEAEARKDMAMTKLDGAGDIMVQAVDAVPAMIGPWSYPESDY